MHSHGSRREALVLWVPFLILSIARGLLLELRAGVPTVETRN